MGLYANLMENGTPMDAIDRMELGRYLEVLQATIRRRAGRAAQTTNKPTGRNVVELKRGTIDDFW